MRSTLRKACEQLVANEALVRKAGRFEMEELIKLGGLVYLRQGVLPDPERIKSCKALLKKRAGLFSNFRGFLEFVVRIKMAAADDPTAYLDEVMHLYAILKEGRIIPGEMVAMCAMTIADDCPAARREEVAAATRDAWAKIREAHPFITEENDMPLIALMCAAGMDAGVAAQKAEEIFQALRAADMPYEASQACAMVLATSPKPTDEKVAYLLSLYGAVKAAKREPSMMRDEAMAIFCPFVDVDLTKEEIVSQIAEVDDWLGKQKGYGPLGVGKKMRRVIAAAMVLQDNQADIASSMAANSAAAIAQALAEAVVVTIMMIIMIEIISTASRSAAH